MFKVGDIVLCAGPEYAGIALRMRKKYRVSAVGAYGDVTIEGLEEYAPMRAARFVLPGDKGYRVDAGPKTL
jgi:hypothetical protein